MIIQYLSRTNMPPHLTGPGNSTMQILVKNFIARSDRPIK